jgi:hypothetical protein
MNLPLNMNTHAISDISQLTVDNIDINGNNINSTTGNVVLQYGGSNRLTCSQYNVQSNVPFDLYATTTAPTDGLSSGLMYYNTSSNRLVIRNTANAWKNVKWTTDNPVSHDNTYHSTNYATDSDLSTHISDTTTHGTSSAIVGINDSQTLTNKNITSPTITTPTISGTGWNNANHAHTAANSGGQLAEAAISGSSWSSHAPKSHASTHYESGGDTVITDTPSSGSNLAISSAWAYNHENPFSGEDLLYEAIEILTEKVEQLEAELCQLKSQK